MKNSSHVSRRSFLKTSAVAATGLPFLRAAGAISPNEKVNLACCGCGCQGANDINALYATMLQRPVA